MPINLDTQHPDYQATQDVRTKSRHIYEGGDVVKAEKTTYLYQENNESDADYTLRLKRAVLDPYVEKIVTARLALLFRKNPERSLPSDLEQWAEDVDRKGTPADVFFSDAAREAMVDGIHWVLIDMPKADEAYPSARAEREAQHRPFFEHVPGNAVIDWSVGPDKRLDWAVVKETINISRPEAGQDIEQVSQWKIWTRTGWQRYQASAGDSGADQAYSLIEQGTHNLGQVPLIPFMGVRRTDYSGWPVCRTILDHVLQIYNKESDLDWFERLLAHPIPYTISPNKPEKLDTGKGLWVQSSADGAPIEVGYMEPTASGFDSIRKSIDSLQARILRIALAQAKKESAQVQSAEGQREDRKIFSSSLTSASQHYQFAEQRCWNLMARWRGITGDIDVTYNTDFEDKRIDETMVKELAELVGGDMITRRTFLQILNEGELMPESFDVDEEIQALTVRTAQGLGEEDTGQAF